MTASSTPTVDERPARSCVAIRSTVTMTSMGTALPPLSVEVERFLTDRGVAASGPPFWRYAVIDMAAELVVEVGLPVDQEVDGDGRVEGGTLPAGRYLTVVHVGHPDGLEAATGDLLDWAANHGLTFDVATSADGEHWGCRLEEYLSDPAEVPDLSQWETRLAFRLRD